MAHKETLPTRRIFPLLGLASAFRKRVGHRIWGRNQTEAPSTPDQEYSSEDALLKEILQRPLDQRDIRMIRAILQMEDVTAREIMVPRVDIVAAEVDTPISQLAQLMDEGGHSRIPIFKDTIDNIVGIIYARDVIKMLSNKEQFKDLQDVARTALFIPDAKKLEDLLKEFQEKRVHIAIVADEYGGVAGLVTIEDLLEEIVGEIEDEFDIGEPEIEVINDNEAVMKASVSIAHMNQVFAVNLEEEEVDTVGGLVYKHLGKMPTTGDEVEVDRLRIRVMSMVGRRIKKVQVIKAQTAMPEKAK